MLCRWCSCLYTLLCIESPLLQYNDCCVESEIAVFTIAHFQLHVLNMKHLSSQAYEYTQDARVLDEPVTDFL